jgi:hypothetical protein
LEALPALVLDAPSEDAEAEAQAIRAYIDCRLKDPVASCAGAAGEG